MVAKLRLGILLAQYGKQQKWLVAKTKIRSNTISNYWHNKAKTINLEHIQLILDAFNEISDEELTPNDLIEYVPDTLPAKKSKNPEKMEVNITD